MGSSAQNTTINGGKNTIVKIGGGSITLKNYQKSDSITLPDGWKFCTSSKASTDTKILTATVENAANIDLTKNYGAKVLRALNITANSSDNLVKSGKGADYISGGAGKDVIDDYAAGDTIKISSGTISKTSYSGKNITFTIGSGSLTVQDGKDKKITITDSNNKTTTQTYSGNVNARTLDLFDDNNFVSTDNQLSDITEKKYSVTQIQIQNYSALAQDSTVLTFTEEK